MLWHCELRAISRRQSWRCDAALRTGGATIFRGDYERSWVVRARPSFFIRLRSVLG
jgi:hypothetical protein